MREGRVSMLTTGSGRLIRKKNDEKGPEGEEGRQRLVGKEGDYPLIAGCVFPFFLFFPSFPLFPFPPRPHFSAMDERGCASSRLPDWVLAASPLHLLF